ncbi:MAG: type 4a pilus biogenesis protein PilO [Myxococcota bacterium]
MAGLKLKGGGGLENLNAVGKVLIGVMFVSLVGVAYFVVFYGEVEGAIASKQQTLTAKKAELSQAREADSAYNKDLTELERRRQLERKQRKILPDEAQSHAFLSSVQTVATISGVELTSWNPKDEDFADFYAKVPMELRLEGKFHQVAKFFHGIGQVDRIINMENIIIEVDTKKADETTVDDTADVEVTCLATAFRALNGDEAGKKRRRRRGANR